MCGRFQLSVKLEDIIERFHTEIPEEPFESSYNCAPGQLLPVITDIAPYRLSPMLWGLVPSWTKELKPNNKNFNCRAETLNEKPSFREPFRRHRCLIPANGFFEWKATDRKQPYRFFLKHEELFAMAGVWDIWKAPDGSQLHSFSIITVEANALVSDLHPRMPAIIPKELETRWLYTTDHRQLLPLLKPYPSSEMDCYPVSAKINSVSGQGEELVRRIVGQNSLFDEDFGGNLG